MELKMETFIPLIKTIYHFAAFSILLYIIFGVKISCRNQLFIKIFLFLMMIFHLYDTYWFLFQKGDAPI